MCGICGVFDVHLNPVDPDLVRRMRATLVHRGPDAAGEYIAGPVGFGVQRLRIIDLAGGDMPLFNEDGSVVVVANGEIYNHVELREALERRGHRFATRSDAEVLVHAYEEWGADCPAHLNGMFAFALWDARRRVLLLARDRVGEKPLFYTLAGGRLVFASEIKALLQDSACGRTVDGEALLHYLTVLYVPYPRSIFRDIAKLPPGHRLLADAAGVRIERYWLPERLAPRRIGLEEAAEELRPLLADAVRLQLRSDVPVGAMLSAGLDSTSIVAHAAANAPQGRLATFAVGFEGAEWDERPGARAVAERFGTDHHELTVSPRDAWALLPRLVWLMGEPMGDGATVPLYVLAAAARPHVTVLLHGAGGDELFAGYPRYAAGVVAPPHRLAAAMPDAIKAAAVGLGGAYSAGFGQRVRVALRTVAQRYGDATAWNTGAERAALTGRDGAPFAAVVAAHYARLAAADPVTRLTFVDLNTYVSDDLLPMVDRTTMGVSLEGRAPFFDHRLVEWTLGLPGDLKLRGGVSKVLVRRAMEGVLPADILQRPKRGFGPPFDLWLRAGLLDYARRLLLDARTRQRGVLRPAAVAELLGGDVADHRTAQRIWMLLVLELWFRIFIDRGDVASPPERLEDLL